MVHSDAVRWRSGSQKPSKMQVRCRWDQNISCIIFSTEFSHSQIGWRFNNYVAWVPQKCQYQRASMNGSFGCSTVEEWRQKSSKMKVRSKHVMHNIFHWIFSLTNRVWLKLLCCLGSTKISDWNNKFQVSDEKHRGREGAEAQKWCKIDCSCSYFVVVMTLYWVWVEGSCDTMI